MMNGINKRKPNFREKIIFSLFLKKKLKINFFKNDLKYNIALKNGSAIFIFKSNFYIIF